VLAGSSSFLDACADSRLARVPSPSTTEQRGDGTGSYQLGLGEETRPRGLRGSRDPGEQLALGRLRGDLVARTDVAEPSARALVAPGRNPLSSPRSNVDQDHVRLQGAASGIASHRGFARGSHH
jgi:hypothetical protein